MTDNCMECGELFTRNKPKKNHWNDRFCSEDCYRVYTTRRNAVIKQMLDKHRAEMLAKKGTTA
jgi:hypothetical protein